MEDEKQAGILRNIFKLSEEADRYKPDEFRISELVFCPAKSYWYRMAKRRPQINGRMLAGLMFHEHLPEIVKDLFGKVEYEKPCIKKYEKFTIAGHADVTSKDRVYEFKFTMTSTKGKLPAYYFLQANAYAHLLEKPNYSVIMVNSMSLALTELEGKTDAEAFKILERQAQEIFDALQTHEPPGGPNFSFECDYCDVKDLCKVDKTNELIQRMRSDNPA